MNVDNAIIGSFGPSRTVQSLSRSEGLLSCSPNGACTHPILELSRSNSIGELIQRAKHAAATGHYSAIDSDGTIFHILSGDRVSICLAACKVWDPIVQQDECMACCVQAAIQNGWTNFGVICCGPSLVTI